MLYSRYYCFLCCYKPRNSNSNQENDEVTLSPLNDKMEQQAISYLDKGDQLKNILHVLNGYHVDAKRIPSVIKKH